MFSSSSYIFVLFFSLHCSFLMKSGNRSYFSLHLLQILDQLLLIINIKIFIGLYVKFLFPKKAHVHILKESSFKTDLKIIHSEIKIIQSMHILFFLFYLCVLTVSILPVKASYSCPRTKLVRNPALTCLEKEHLKMVLN